MSSGACFCHHISVQGQRNVRCQHEREELRYPEARRLDLTEDVLGYQVSDPYRWLEDAASTERAGWLAGQSGLYTAERDGWPGRAALAEQVRALLSVGYVGTPAWRGERSFFSRRDPGQEHAVLCTQVADGPAEVLIDPMAIDPSGLTTLDAWQPDKEGRLLAYQLSQGGDEESLLRVLDVETGALVDGPIDRCRYSNVAWLPGGKAFYYTRRLPPDAGARGRKPVPPAGVPAPARHARRRGRADLRHRPGQDRLLLGVGQPGRPVAGHLRVPGHRAAERPVAGRPVRIRRVRIAWATPDLRVVQEGVDAQTWVRVGRDGLLYLFTDADAPRGRMAVADPAAAGLADRASWRDLIREDPEAVLRGFALLDGPELARPVLLATWTRHALSEITVHDLATGERLSEVPLPGLGTAGGLSERPEGGHEAWFGYTDYTTPPVILRFDARTFEVTTWASPPGSVAVPAVATRQVTYASADGTPVRMLVISPASAWARQDGPNGPDRPRPAILTGYGGFDISLTPAFSPNTLAWVSAGGVYAVANLRGGSEEGEQWHRAGMLEQQAERVRRLLRRRGDADRGRLDHPWAAGHLRRVQRRAAGRRGPDPAARAVRRRGLLGTVA